MPPFLFASFVSLVFIFFVLFSCFFYKLGGQHHCIPVFPECQGIAVGSMRRAPVDLGVAAITAVHPELIKAIGRLIKCFAGTRSHEERTDAKLNYIYIFVSVFFF